MAVMKECEIFLLVDEDGTYIAHEDHDALMERIEDNDIQPGRRIVRILVNVPLPTMLEAAATIEEEAEATAAAK